MTTQPRGPVDWARHYAAERAERQAADPATIRTPQELSDAVECAIGLNVDCGGTEGVHRVRDAVLAAIRPVWDRLAEYENTINWMTTCTGCARILDSCIRETERAERAEAAIERVRGAVEALCHEPHPSHDHVCPDDVRKAVRAALQPPAHNTGPSVAECAQADRRWSLEKHGE
jgi:hypothetical protein